MATFRTPGLLTQQNKMRVETNAIAVSCQLTAQTRLSWPTQRRVANSSECQIDSPEPPQPVTQAIRVKGSGVPYLAARKGYMASSGCSPPLGAVVGSPIRRRAVVYKVASPAGRQRALQPVLRPSEAQVALYTSSTATKSHQVALDRTNCRGKSEPRSILFNAACCLLRLHGSASCFVEYSGKRVPFVEHSRSARPMKQLMTAGGGVSLALPKTEKLFLKSIDSRTMPLIKNKGCCDSAAVCHFRTVSL